MWKETHPHFVTGDYKTLNVYLEDEEYGRALDCLVKACTDLLICHSDDDEAHCRILLGKRIVEPQPDWWYMGGRMKRGETPEESMSRLVKRELLLTVHPSRFKLLGYHSYAWARRQQPPSDNGTCDLSIILTLTLQPGEFEQIHMDDKEFSEFKWFTVQDILEIGNKFHPALRESARDLQSRHVWKQLKKAVKNGESTSAISETARKLVLGTSY